MRKVKKESQPNGGFWKQLFWFMNVHISKFIILMLIMSILTTAVITWLTTDIVIQRNSKGKLQVHKIQKKGADAEIKLAK